jgi:hypothetical protein
VKNFGVVFSDQATALRTYLGVEPMRLTHTNCRTRCSHWLIGLGLALAGCASGTEDPSNAGIDNGSPDDGGNAWSESGYAEDSGSSRGSDSVSSDTVPATCRQADSKVGCCVGNVVYYCDPTLTSKTCTGSDVCGWDGTSDYYDCLAPPGRADPTGSYPRECK